MPELDRRSLLRAGLTVSAVAATGIGLSLPASAAPIIAGTREWGARPPRGTIDFRSIRPTKIIVHHTATGNTGDFSRAHAFALSRSIQNFHMDSRGWIDTGQHFTNSRGGWLTEGRHRSLEALRSGNRHVVAAHVSGQNTVALGIENEGLYTSVNVPQALWNSLVELCRHMCAQYRINPGQIFGHRDFNATACPGDVLYRRLPELRRAVGTALGVAVEEPPTWPLLRPGDSGERVMAAQHLLRGHGARSVPVDGMFGPATAAAAQHFARAAHIEPEPCYATAHTDERGLIAADVWRALVRPTRAGESTEFGAAARVLLAAQGRGPRASAVIGADGWLSLLAENG